MSSTGSFTVENRERFFTTTIAAYVLTRNPHHYVVVQLFVIILTLAYDPTTPLVVQHIVSGYPELQVNYLVWLLRLLLMSSESWSS